MFWKYQSLFVVKISLLLILGNLRRNDDEPLGICSGSGLNLPEFAKFPVKFPVSREMDRRLVRSALCRQPTSPPCFAESGGPRTAPLFRARFGGFRGLKMQRRLTRDPHGPSLWASTGPISPHGRSGVGTGPG